MANFKVGDELVQANDIEGATYIVNAVGKENYLIQDDTYGCEFLVYIGGSSSDGYKLKPVKVWTNDDIQPGTKLVYNARKGIVYNICECKGDNCVVSWISSTGELTAYVEEKAFFVDRLNKEKYTKVS